MSEHYKLRLSDQYRGFWDVVSDSGAVLFPGNDYAVAAALCDGANEAAVTKETTMSQAYSDPKRASEPGALPDVEMYHRDSCFVRFGLHGGGCGLTTGNSALSAPGAGCRHEGWYWQRTAPAQPLDVAQFEGEPNGPFATEAEALADAQSVADGIDGAADGGDCVDCDGPCRGHEPGTNELPQCVLAMRCYCAGHARGLPASAPCDTTE